MSSINLDISKQTALYCSNEAKVDELDGEENPCFIVEIRSPVSSESLPCRRCESQKRKRQERSVYARIRRFLLGGINIEAKLKRYNVKSHRPSSPFNFLRKLLGSLFHDDADSKFTDKELETLRKSQLQELRKSLQNLVSDRRLELERERMICGEERDNLEKTKQQAREIEAVAWVTLKPFINHHPSLDDLTRVLMF